MNISVIGNGFVGGAVANGFKHREPLIYDVDPSRSNCSLNQALDANYIFICLELYTSYTIKKIRFIYLLYPLLFLHFLI